MHRTMASDEPVATRRAPLVREVVLVLVGETEATEPMVADGAPRSEPLCETAAAERDAKPTDFGDDRYTEYTFFYRR